MPTSTFQLEAQAAWLISRRNQHPDPEAIKRIQGQLQRQWHLLSISPTLREFQETFRPAQVLAPCDI